MKTHTPLLQLALCLAFCGPMGALADSDAVVQPLNDPQRVPPGPLLVLPPLAQELPTPPESDAAKANGADQLPLLCACLPLDYLESLA